MKVFRCPSCETSFTGWRCPACRNPLTIVAAFVILLIAFGAMAVLSIAIPEEVIPRVVDRGDGASQYYFTSLRNAIGIPVFLLVFISSPLVVDRLFRVRTPKTRRSEPDAPERSPAGRFAKAVVWFILGSLLLMIVAVLVLGVVVMPLTAVRSVTVDENSVEFHALLRSWSIPRERIKRVELVQADVARRKGQRGRFYFTFEDDSGHRYKTEWGMYVKTNLELRRYNDTLKRLKQHLSQR